MWYGSFAWAYEYPPPEGWVRGGGVAVMQNVHDKNTLEIISLRINQNCYLWGTYHASTLRRIKEQTENIIFSEVVVDKNNTAHFIRDEMCA